MLLLALGIIHEPLVRWIEDPIRVLASTQTFTPTRLNPETGQHDGDGGLYVEAGGFWDCGNAQ